MRRAYVLLALLALPAQAEPVRQQREADRQALRANGRADRDVWKALPAGGQLRPPLVDIHARGSVVVIKTREPEVRNGVQGIRERVSFRTRTTPAGATQEDVQSRRALKAAVHTMVRSAYKLDLTRVLDATLKGFLGGAVDSPTAAARRGIAGAVQGLGDRWAAYYDPAAAKAQKIHNQGQLVGIGVTLADGVGGPVIAKVTPRAPAAKAGIQDGTRLVAVNGQRVRDTKHAIQLLKGQEKEKVVLTVMQGTRLVQIQMERERFKSDVTEVKVTRDGIAVARFPWFYRGVDRELETHLAQAAAQHGGKLRGIVLDLRQNGGGFLMEAHGIVNLFLRSGIMARYKSRDGTVEDEPTADPKKATFADVPLAILVDPNTVSAAEFTPAILKDLGRAVIIGQKTFGKGVMQSTWDLPEGSSVKFTTGGFFTPSGTTTQDVGVIPDIDRAEATRRSIARHGAAARDVDLDEAYAQLRRVSSRPAPQPQRQQAQPATSAGPQSPSLPIQMPETQRPRSDQLEAQTR